MPRFRCTPRVECGSARLSVRNTGEAGTFQPTFPTTNRGPRAKVASPVVADTATLASARPRSHTLDAGFLPPTEADNRQAAELPANQVRLDRCRYDRVEFLFSGHCQILRVLVGNPDASHCSSHGAGGEVRRQHRQTHRGAGLRRATAEGVPQNTCWGRCGVQGPLGVGLRASESISTGRPGRDSRLDSLSRPSSTRYGRSSRDCSVYTGVGDFRQMLPRP